MKYYHHSLLLSILGRSWVLVVTVTRELLFIED
jgi:hypothetical protein